MALSAAEKQAQYRLRKSELDRVKAHGRLLGEDEADRRGEVGSRREERVAAAVRYAVWLFEGKPVSGVPLAVDISS